MAGRYATTTDVSSAASREEIETVLRRYGATTFTYGWSTNAAIVGFEVEHRSILMRIPMPDPNDRRFTHTPTRGQPRDQTAREKEYEQAVRQVWRALALVIKAKLEAAAAGISTLEAEFLAHIVMPDGRTVGDHTAPAIEAAYASGEVPALLPGPTGPTE